MLSARDSNCGRKHRQGQMGVVGGWPGGSKMRGWTPGGGHMKSFDPNAYGSVFAELLGERRLAPLGPGSSNRGMRRQLEGLSIETAFAGRSVRDRDMAACCLAA